MRGVLVAPTWIKRGEEGWRRAIVLGAWGCGVFGNGRGAFARRRPRPRWTLRARRRRHTCLCSVRRGTQIERRLLLFLRTTPSAEQQLHHVMLLTWNDHVEGAVWVGISSQVVTVNLVPDLDLRERSVGVAPEQGEVVAQRHFLDNLLDEPTL